MGKHPELSPGCLAAVANSNSSSPVLRTLVKSCWTLRKWEFKSLLVQPHQKLAEVVFVKWSMEELVGKKLFSSLEHESKSSLSILNTSLLSSSQSRWKDSSKRWALYTKLHLIIIKAPQCLKEPLCVQSLCGGYDLLILQIMPSSYFLRVFWCIDFSSFFNSHSVSPHSQYRPSAGLGWGAYEVVRVRTQPVGSTRRPGFS
jgi:hypothetical protein